MIIFAVGFLGGRDGGGPWVCLFSFEANMLSEEEVFRLRCQGKASLEKEAKTVKVLSPNEKWHLFWVHLFSIHLLTTYYVSGTSLGPLSQP